MRAPEALLIKCHLHAGKVLEQNNVFAADCATVVVVVVCVFVSVNCEHLSLGEWVRERVRAFVGVLLCIHSQSDVYHCTECCCLNESEFPMGMGRIYCGFQ